MHTTFQQAITSDVVGQTYIHLDDIPMFTTPDDVWHLDEVDVEFVDRYNINIKNKLVTV